VPVFLRVTACSTLIAPTDVDRNATVAGVMVRPPVVVAAPVPLRVTFCGEVAALSAASRRAVSVPVFVGAKAMVTVHEAPAASVVAAVEVVQVPPVREKDVAFVPEMVMPLAEMVSAVVPVFLSVAVKAALLDPTLVLANVSVAGLKVAVGLVVVVGQFFTRLATFMVPSPVVRS
jgi:hypothetical protein